MIPSRRQFLLSFVCLVTLALPVSLLAMDATPAPPATRIDHLILGAPDLDKAVEEFEKVTGVRPVYGGKHPRGTHNALASLGEGVYLEILALQPGVTSSPGMDDLAKLARMAPVGWAVAATDVEGLQRSLPAAGFPLSPPRPGSRTTPAGLTLEWQTLGLANELAEAPFFIVWGPGTKHPSETAPSGCTLMQWVVAGPRAAEMRKLHEALGLKVEVREAQAPSFTLTLSCPKGAVTFEPI